jgi:hypothetical protein
MRDLYSKCGCNCSHCPAFKENAKTMEDKRRCSEGWAKYLGAKLKPDSIQCEGCQAKERLLLCISLHRPEDEDSG